MKKAAFALLLATPLLASANTDFRGLMLKAMHAPGGTYSTEVTGKAADIIRARINRPHARVQADVSTVAALKQEGCKRFQIRFTTPGTLLPTTDGQSRMLDMSIMLNMCPNGLPPGIQNEQQLSAETAKAMFELAPDRQRAKAQ